MVLRNVVPRQGTETNYKKAFDNQVARIEKCSSPTGDGNWAIGAIIVFPVNY